MATWSINPENQGATIDNNGVFTVEANLAFVTRSWEITYTDDKGNSVSKIVTQDRRKEIDGHECVEINGVKWATMNIGANSVTDYGLYFQWGDTQGYTAEQVGSGSGQKAFKWTDYKYGNGTSSPDATGMTKYNSTDGKTALDASDDAVQVAWGGRWRMPTTAEYAALGEAVNTAWTADYQGSGVSGLVLTDKTDSSNVLFFPAAGHCVNGSVYNVGSLGIYWSSSIYSSNVQNGYSLYSSSSSVDWQHYNRRYLGFAVRGVVGE